MHTTRIATFGATALIAGGLLAGYVSAVGAPSADTRAAGHAVRFDKPQQNPYFPLRPGTVSRYRGSDEGDRFREFVRVTHRTKKIQGVTTRVVRDVVRRLDGSISEKTDDWYATDNDGNVWYFGERTATYDRHGHVESREGSWKAGVDGAIRGLIMPANPRPTDGYRQEFYQGHAEDQAWIVQRNTRIKVPVREAWPRRAQLRVEPPRARRDCSEVLCARLGDRPRAGSLGRRRALRAGELLQAMPSESAVSAATRA